MISRRAFLSQAGLLALAGGGAWWLRETVIWPDPKISFAQGRSSGWLAFTEPGQGMPIIPARIGGVAVEALLDSGAQSSVIDRGLAERLGLKTSTLGPLILAVGLSGGAQVGRAATLDITLGALTLSDLRAALFDVAPISSASGRPFAVILGQDVLAHLVADIDFPGARLAFADPAAYAPPVGARSVPIRRRRRELKAPLLIEGRPLDAVIDTGSSGALSLSRSAAQDAGLLQGREVASAPSITFGGLAQDQIVQINDMVFAGRSYGELSVRIHPSDGPAVLPDGLPDGLIGVAALDRFRVIMDVSGARLHLLP